MVIHRLIYPPIALKFVNSVLWKYLTPLKIPEEVLKRPEDSWRSQKIERVLQDWQQERPQGKPHRAPLFNPVFAFEQAHNKPHFYEEKKYWFEFFKSETELELKMNMNKFYGGWSPMGQAFKSMQNQRGFEYRKLDAIKFENLLRNNWKKEHWNI